MKKINFVLLLLALLLSVTHVGASGKDFEDCRETLRKKIAAAFLKSGRPSALVPSSADAIILQACERIQDKSFASTLKPMAEIRAHDPILAREKRARKAADDAWFASMQCGSTPPEAFADSFTAYYFEKHDK